MVYQLDAHRNMLNKNYMVFLYKYGDLLSFIKKDTSCIIVCVIQWMTDWEKHGCDVNVIVSFSQLLLVFSPPSSHGLSKRS